MDWKVITTKCSLLLSLMIWDTTYVTYGGGNAAAIAIKTLHLPRVGRYWSHMEATYFYLEQETMVKTIL